MTETILAALEWIVPLIFAIVFHEVAHGLMARALGDPTAQEQNRLSLNPLRHVDPIGTVILPGMLALAKAPIFGWAKPVPVSQWRLRNPRYGMMVVAAAGPAMNLVMAAVGAIFFGLLAKSYGGIQQPTGAVGFVSHNLANFIQINVFLALFNLLPIPPFDGSHIVEGLLPRPLAAGYAKMRAMGMLIPIMLLIVVPSLFPGLNVVGYIYAPVRWVIGQYDLLAAFVAAP